MPPWRNTWRRRVPVALAGRCVPAWYVGVGTVVVVLVEHKHIPSSISTTGGCPVAHSKESKQISKGTKRDMAEAEAHGIVIVGGGICGLATALALHR